MKATVRWKARMAGVPVRQAACAAACLAMLGFGGTASAQALESGCQPRHESNSIAQDYRLTTPQSRANVERRHFTRQVETLIRGESTSRPAPDIEYTLGKFPNHHRALIAMMRLGQRHKTDRPPGSDRTVGCWFQLALAFAPDDTVVRGFYATHLHAMGRKDAAMQQLTLARHHAEGNPMSIYSIGAVYYDMGEFELALELAHEARRLGDPRNGLEQALRSTGHWRDPPLAPPT